MMAMSTLSLYWQTLSDLLAGFAWPWMWLAMPLPLLARVLLPAQRGSAPALRVPYAAQLQAVAAAPARGGLWRVGLWLTWLAWFCLCAAAARPLQLGEPISPPQQARQLMLAVDLSGSMSEPDMTLGGRVVDRLTAAKAVLADFLDRRDGDRIGLLVFGQKAYALTPLTADLATVRDQLRDSVVGLAGRETALGDAIALSVKRLREQPQGDRVLIVLTDGVNTAGVLEPSKAAELAKAEHVRVYTIAFGGAGGYSLFGLPMPGGGGGDDQVDEDTLRKIAQDTGGRFFRARDTDQLVSIYAELERLEPVRSAGPAVRPRTERYAWPLGAALLLGLIAFVWPWRRQ
ncbi:VWA domain-containing protein [Xanthomonas translucens]|uniref:vWA domain-containing protein n=1 Tax=Xanthomonas campestris pv. translucens TaxID=343 RepID=UPI001F34C5C9|nr:VWA domain-containing protein [Xanthomonas translucens]UKE51596.1 VWA domain-containing protein [Xanthomonas translucens]